MFKEESWISKDGMHDRSPLTLRGVPIVVAYQLMMSVTGKGGATVRALLSTCAASPFSLPSRSLIRNDQAPTTRDFLKKVSGGLSHDVLS